MILDIGVSSGDFKDITLDQAVNGVQSKYVTIIGSNNAICLSWITLTNKDGAANAAWTGDVGFNCGQSWTWGNQVAGNLNDGSGSYSPRCTWLDADHTNDIKTGAMKINFLAYGEELKDTINSGTACDKTAFSADAGEIDGTRTPPNHFIQRK
jgi:hypothetical protein